MIYPAPRSFSSLVLSLCLVLSPMAATAVDWPKDFVIAENSASPDGKYGVLIPETAGDDETPINYLANLKKHKLLGKIQDGDYFLHENHRWLTVHWAEDSSWCSVEYGGRFGFGTLLVLEPTADRVSQREIGELIHRDLNAAIAKQSHDPTERGPATLICEPAADRKLIVHALATTNPKSLEGVTTYCSAFQGCYDLKSRRWLSSVTRPVDASDYDALDFALSYEAGDALAGLKSIENEEDQARDLDEKLNQMYQAAKVLLPPERFANLKKEQIAWLKTRDAEKSTPERFKLIAARIDTLSKLLP